MFFLVIKTNGENHDPCLQVSNMTFKMITRLFGTNPLDGRLIFNGIATYFTLKGQNKKFS